MTIDDPPLAAFGYNRNDIVMLTDDARNPRQVPTKENIVCHRFDV
jgi:metacaspase-1